MIASRYTYRSCPVLKIADCRQHSQDHAKFKSNAAAAEKLPFQNGRRGRLPAFRGGRGALGPSGPVRAGFRPLRRYGQNALGLSPDIGPIRSTAALPWSATLVVSMHQDRRTANIHIGIRTHARSETLPGNARPSRHLPGRPGRPASVQHSHKHPCWKSSPIGADSRILQRSLQTSFPQFRVLARFVQKYTVRVRL